MITIPTRIRTTPVISVRVKEVPMMPSARSSSPLPLAMEHRGGPPVPMRLEKAVMAVITGKATPTPVRAAELAPGILPI